MVVSGKAAVKEKELSQLRKSGKKDIRTISQIEELQWKLDSHGGFGNKRNKKRGGK